MDNELNMNEFGSWKDFDDFKRAVKSSSRFAIAPDVRRFLDVVRGTAGNRMEVYPKGKVFFRAQMGTDVRSISVDRANGYVEVEERVPYGCQRMKPDPTKVEDGRANPKGIAFLYLASDWKTSVAEMRPWIGDTLSVAEFTLTKELRIVDACKGGTMREILVPLALMTNQVPPEKLETHIWTRIGHAFSQPANRSDARLEYLPTQMIAESLRIDGFDGISYKSRTEDGSGTNLVLFNPANAEMERCTTVEIDQVNTPIKNEESLSWRNLQEWLEE